MLVQTGDDAGARVVVGASLLQAKSTSNDTTMTANHHSAAVARAHTDPAQHMPGASYHYGAWGGAS